MLKCLQRGKWLEIRTMLVPKVAAPLPGDGLERASVDVGDVAKESRGRGQEGRRGGGGGHRRGRGRLGRGLLALGVRRRAVSLDAAVVKPDSAHQEFLLHRRLVPELLKPQLILPLPLGPVWFSFVGFLSSILMLFSCYYHATATFRRSLSLKNSPVASTLRANNLSHEQPHSYFHCI
jgi:hypothetical protein